MEINIALNRLGNAWDYAKLREDMLQLQEAGYDLTKTAFTDTEVAELTRDMNASLDSFFEEAPAADSPEKPKHTYKCPFCGEIFEH